MSVIRSFSFWRDLQDVNPLRWLTIKGTFWLLKPQETRSLFVLGYSGEEGQGRELVKEAMSPKAHARVDEKHFYIVGPTFSFKYRRRVKEAVFMFESRSSSKKIADFFIYKRSLVITEAVCCDIFGSFSNGGKAKLPRRVVCKLVLTELYYACAPAEIVPLNKAMRERGHDIRCKDICLESLQMKSN